MLPRIVVVIIRVGPGTGPGPPQKHNDTQEPDQYREQIEVPVKLDFGPCLRTQSDAMIGPILDDIGDGQLGKSQSHWHLRKKKTFILLHYTLSRSPSYCMSFVIDFCRAL